MTSLSVDERIARINKTMDTYSDFPKPGINFIDIFPIMRDPDIFADLISLIVEHIQQTAPQVQQIIGLDARGFVIGPLIAQKLCIGFAPIRKAGKLPGETLQASYTLEYGADKFEAQKACVKAGEKVIIVDDLLATGGTLSAACTLMRNLQADILECIVLVELTDLNGREKNSEKIFSLIKRQG